MIENRTQCICWGIGSGWVREKRKTFHFICWYHDQKALSISLSLSLGLHGYSPPKKKKKNNKKKHTTVDHLGDLMPLFLKTVSDCREKQLATTQKFFFFFFKHESVFSHLMG